MKRNVIVLISGLALSALLAGCTVTVEDAEDAEPHSREAIASYASGENFGMGKDDFGEIALDYVYHDESMEDRYGDSFVVEESGGSADNTTVFGFTKGNATYYVTIEGDRWVIELTKEYGRKWTVESCALEDATPQ